MKLAVDMETLLDARMNVRPGVVVMMQTLKLGGHELFILAWCSNPKDDKIAYHNLHAAGMWRHIPTKNWYFLAKRQYIASLAMDEKADAVVVGCDANAAICEAKGLRVIRSHSTIPLSEQVSMLLPHTVADEAVTTGLEKPQADIGSRTDA